MSHNKTLIITSPSFQDNGMMPKKHTGFGEDRSPALEFENLCENAVSIAIIMDDLDIPFIKAYNHWLIWNIPKMDQIPEHIPYGERVSSLGNTVQGVGYGRDGIGIQDWGLDGSGACYKRPKDRSYLVFYKEQDIILKYFGTY